MVRRKESCCRFVSGLSGPRFRLSGPVSVRVRAVSGLSGLKPLFGRARTLTPLKALGVLIEKFPAKKLLLTIARKPYARMSGHGPDTARTAKNRARTARTARTLRGPGNFKFRD